MMTLFDLTAILYLLRCENLQYICVDFRPSAVVFSVVYIIVKATHYLGIADTFGVSIIFCLLLEVFIVLISFATCLG